MSEWKRRAPEIDGEASRYVTQERLQQMLDTEYDLVDSNLRKTKGEDACFFAFASTVAAKAFMSNRECEGGTDRP